MLSRDHNLNLNRFVLGMINLTHNLVSRTNRSQFDSNPKGSLILEDKHLLKIVSNELVVMTQIRVDEDLLMFGMKHVLISLYL